MKLPEHAILFCYIACFGVSAAIAAEPPTGTLIPGHQSSSLVQSEGYYSPTEDEAKRLDAMELKPSDSAIAAGRVMAKCMVTKKPNEVQLFLNSTNRAEASQTISKLNESLSKCIAKSKNVGSRHTRLSLSNAAMVGLLSEAWIARIRQPALNPEPYAHSVSDLEWLTDDVARKETMRLATCLVTSHPLEVANLLKTQPLSPEETVPLNQLLPNVSKCLAKNVTLRLNKSSLRLSLAAAFYKRASLASASPSSGTNR